MDLIQTLSASVQRPSNKKMFCIPDRIYYAVSHAYPFSSNGYAVRTHGVAAGLVRAGCSVVSVTRPGVPWDRPGFSVMPNDVVRVIDGVRYLHTPLPPGADGGLNEGTVQIHKNLMRVFKPKVVMAASNWHNALPAALAARVLGIPFFYEVRGFWEISQLARTPEWAGSPGYVREVEGETAVARNADRVFTLNRFMRDELIHRGVEPERIELVPNGFSRGDTESSEALTRSDLGIRSRYVVGYVGSFNVYEGLEELIQALASLRHRGIDVSLLLVGSGEPRGLDTAESPVCEKTSAYRALAQTLGVSDFLFMPGRVPPSQSASYYTLIDVVVVPRRPFAVCELVSPMKPLEAASHGKRVLMSDVAPLADLAKLSKQFRLYEKGRVESLSDQLENMLLEPYLPNENDQAIARFAWENNVVPMVESVRQL